MKISNKLFTRLSDHDKALKKALKNLLGFSPRYLPYYVVSLTHRSKTDRISQNNERLEYLGDAFIGAIVAEYLFKKYPTQDEGFLTEMRSKIVSRNSLNEIARRMGLQKLIRFNQADKMLRRSQIYGNALEALVGAIYLDVGFEKTRTFILRQILATYVDMEALENTDYNFKNKLYTWAQRHDKTLKFVTVNEHIEGGRKLFTIGIMVDDELRVQASGFSKKEAGQLAAKAAVEDFATDED